MANTIASNVQVTGPNGPPSITTMVELATTAYAIEDRVITSRMNATVAGDATNSVRAGDAGGDARRRCSRSCTRRA